MYEMVKNIDPPLGFGNKCPNRVAYKKLIRMNMPMDDDKKVAFTTTLFALIRENLQIKMRPRKLHSQTGKRYPIFKIFNLMIFSRRNGHR